jgi:hypothetical protein
MLTRHAIIFGLSNNNLQVNFFDQTEIFQWAEQPRFVTCVSKARQRATFDIGEAAGVPVLAKRVKDIRDILAQLIGKAYGLPRADVRQYCPPATCNSRLRGLNLTWINNQHNGCWCQPHLQDKTIGSSTTTCQLIFGIS